MLIQEALQEVKNGKSIREDVSNDFEAIRLPVNVSVFDHYYGSQSHYKYLDEYLYKDKISVYDIKDSRNVKKGSDWLKNLTRTNKQVYERTPDGAYKNSYHLIHSNDHVDWTTNRAELRLRDMLQLEVESPTLFTPLEKKIYIRQDYKHQNRVDIYSMYLRKEKELRNHYYNVSFGRLHEDASHVDEVMDQNFSSWGNTCVEAQTYFEPKKLKFSRVINEGYEGKCGYIPFKHPEFSVGNDVKWSTPYAAYRYRQHDWKSETYYYLLGDFAVRESNTRNLRVGNKKTAWFVDYQKYFKVDYNSGYLTISLDESLIKNPKDFLTISSELDFQLEFRINKNLEVHKFNIEDVVKGTAKIQVDSGNLFSDFFLVVSSKHEDIEIMNYSGNLRYELNIEALKNKSLIFNGLSFYENEVTKYFPSELLHDDKLMNHFFFYSGNRRSKINLEFYKSLNVHLETNDLTGVATLTYHDPFLSTEKTVTIENMQSLPKFNHLRLDVNSLDEVKEIIRRQINKDYFWKNVLFTPVKPSPFDSREYFVLENRHRNQIVQSQWDFSDLKISIPNKNDLSLIVKKDLPNKNYKHLSDFFELNSLAKTKRLSLFNYKFDLLDNTGDQLTIRVSLNHGGINGSKDYYIDFSSGEVLESFASNEEQDSDYYDHLYEIFCGAGGIIIGGGATSMIINGSKILRRKF